MAGKPARLKKAPSGAAAVFLDRDGTVIREEGYLSDPDKVELVPGAAAAIKLLQANGFRVFIATNQSGIARKFFTDGRLFEIHERLAKLLAAEGVKLDGIFYCPHGPDDGCGCRKPRAGMAESAAKAFGLDLKKSFSVGDKLTDALFGRGFGGRGVLVLTGYGKQESEKVRGPGGEGPDFTAQDLADAAGWIIKNAKNSQR